MLLESADEEASGTGCQGLLAAAPWGLEVSWGAGTGLPGELGAEIL